MSEDAPTATLPATGAARSPGTQLTGFAAGITGAALLSVGVWGLHVLTPSGGAVGSVGWVVLLLAAFSALGKGIILIRRALAPVTAAALAPLAGISAPVRAMAGIVIGAVGIWWVMRGHAASWWTQITGSATGWTLTSQLVQVAIVTAAGALLFGGTKTLAAAIFANSGTRDRQHNLQSPSQQRWLLWWSSHPGLGLTLLAGAAALVFLSGYVVPRVSAWLTGDDLMAALAAITAILVVAFAANTWWWKALSGWWQWAHTYGSGGGGASPLGQMQAGAAVIALVWFSAMGFGLASPQDYAGPGAAPLARAACPPDCGGGGGLDGPPGGGSQFRPPDMPAQQPDYSGGLNQAPLNQNSGVSIYNESPGQAGPQQGSQNMGPQMSGQRAAHGEPLPNYGPWQPDAQAPVQQVPVQQAPQAPQQPAQAPQNPAGQQPVQQPPQQPVQQVPQQQPGAQQPQGQPGQQPAQQPQSGQNQPGQQQPQNPANQQNPAQKQPDQTPQKQPDRPKKNPIDPTDLATAATRRGSQQAGQQATQQTGQQAAQQATQQSTRATQQTQQATQQTSQQAAQQTNKQKPKTGFDDWANGEQGANLSRRGTVDKMGNLLGSAGDGLDEAAKAAKAADSGSDLARMAKGAKFLKGVGPVGDVAGGLMDGFSGKKSWGDAAGSTASGIVGGAIGGTLGSAFGPVGTAIGSYVGNKAGQALWDHRQGIIDAVKDPADAVSKIGGQISSAASSLANDAGSAIGSGLKAVGNFLW